MCQILLAEERELERTNIKFKENSHFQPKYHYHFFPSSFTAKMSFSFCAQWEMSLKLCCAIPDKCWTKYKGIVYQKWKPNLWVVITDRKFLLCLMAHKSLRVMGKDITVWIIHNYYEQFETIQFCLSYMEDYITRK